MKYKFSFLYILFFLTFSLVYSQKIKLIGKAEPGGVLIGEAKNIKTVLFDGHKIGFDERGYFLIGFDRDAKGTHTIKAIFKNGKSEIKKIKLPKRKYIVQRLKLAEKYVVPPDSELSRIEEEMTMMKEAREKIGLIDSAFYVSGFISPVENASISSVFGSQRILNGIPKKPHNGIDFAADEGTPVHAAADGIVAIAGDNFYFNGNFVLLDHGQGLSTVYLHMSKLNVKTDDRVKKGQVIGLVGSTGRATGPHLHWGAQWFNKRIDPMNLLNLGFLQ
ncbi:M23 family metallopeptidase [Melioribacteraceae bacterium 4301-Me]|uniref:M23 family metallopeptidase n=1 Tax=Pyranulibacter aquaticus TaxID=3163344 RepID=UPI003595D0A2